jgi:hypothetical protein
MHTDIHASNGMDHALARAATVIGNNSKFSQRLVLTLPFPYLGRDGHGLISQTTTNVIEDLTQFIRSLIRDSKPSPSFLVDSYFIFRQFFESKDYITSNMTIINGE